MIAEQNRDEQPKLPTTEGLFEVKYPEVQEAPRYSCSLSGAYAAVVGLYGSVPILHSGGGCGIGQLFGQFYAGGENSPGGQGGTSTPCTSMVEQQVIFGGDDKLKRLIKSSLELMTGDLYVVITGCIPALIGDDVESVVKKFKNDAPVIYVKTAGFSGNTYTGYEQFFDAVIDQLLVHHPKQKRLINILGVVPFQHVFWKGDLEKLKETFKKIGVDANIIFGEFDGVNNLKKIPAAELNVILSPWLCHKTAEKLSNKFGTPYITFPSIPVGPKETTALLQNVAKKLNLKNDDVQIAIDKEERIAYRRSEYFGDPLLIGLPHAYTAVVADSATAIGITQYVANNVGYLPEVVIITDNPPEEYHKDIIRELSDNIECAIKPEIIFESDSYRIRQKLKNRRFLLLLASSLEKHITGDFNHALHLSVSFPILDRTVIEHSYAGYRGGNVLMEDIISKYVGPL